MIGRSEVPVVVEEEAEEEAVVPDNRIHPMAGATNLAPQVVVVVAAAAQVAAQIPVSAEMIGANASLVPAEHLKVETEKDPIEQAGHHCVSPTLGDDKEEVRAADLSERGTEQLNERLGPRLLRNVERLFCQSKSKYMVGVAVQVSYLFMF